MTILSQQKADRSQYLNLLLGVSGLLQFSRIVSYWVLAGMPVCSSSHEKYWCVDLANVLGANARVNIAEIHCCPLSSGQAVHLGALGFENGG